MPRNEIFMLPAVTMVTEVCCNCGIVFAMPSYFRDTCYKDGMVKTFYCPNGHGQSYTKSAVQREKEKYAEEKQLLEKQLEATRRDLSNSDYVKMMLEKDLKKERNKLKRVHNGTCPCCNRSFSNLQAHMKTKHPDIAVSDIKNPVHTKINKRESKVPKK